MNPYNIRISPLREAAVKDSGSAPNYLRLLRIRRELQNQGFESHVGSTYGSFLYGNGDRWEYRDEQHLVFKCAGLSIEVANFGSISPEDITDSFIDEVLAKLVDRYNGIVQ